jgi:hypothetical protein
MPMAAVGFSRLRAVTAPTSAGLGLLIAIAVIEFFVPRCRACADLARDCRKHPRSQQEDVHKLVASHNANGCRITPTRIG